MRVARYFESTLLVLFLITLVQGFVLRLPVGSAAYGLEGPRTGAGRHEEAQGSGGRLLRQVPLRCQGPPETQVLVVLMSSGPSLPLCAEVRTDGGSSKSNLGVGERVGVCAGD